MGDDVRAGWRFGPYEIRPATRSLIRVNKSIHLRPAEMDLLTLIVKAEGQPVHREEILRTVWPGADIAESILNTTFSRLRKSLDEDTIEWVPSRGYRVSYPVERLDGGKEHLAKYLISLFSDEEEKRQTTSDDVWDAQCLRHLPDVQAAMDWALEKPMRRQIAIRLAGSSGLLWERSSALEEGRSYVERTLNLLDDDVTPLDRAALYRCAGLMWREADRQTSLGFLEKAEKLYRTNNDLKSLTYVLALIGDQYVLLGRHDEATATLIETEMLANAHGQLKILMITLNARGLLCMIQNNLAEARYFYNSVRDIARRLGDRVREYICVLNIAEVECYDGALDRAIERAREAAHGLRNAPTTYRARPIVNLATYEALAKNYTRAKMYALDALGILQNDHGYWVRLPLQILALACAAGDRAADGCKLAGFVQEQFHEFGETKHPAEREIYSNLMTFLREKLSPESIDVWLAEGAEWDEVQAVDYVKTHLIDLAEIKIEPNASETLCGSGA
jgi:DNA-binding winged helix-turn-helix (wHTH) protein